MCAYLVPPHTQNSSDDEDSISKWLAGVLVVLIKMSLNLVPRHSSGDVGVVSRFP